jgi:hypothetical protein
MESFNLRQQPSMEEKHLVSNRTIKFTWLENKSMCIIKNKSNELNKRQSGHLVFKYLKVKIVNFII